MAENSVQRRLAAILAADAVGYTRLMADDEVGTLHSLRQLRAEVIDPAIDSHKGRIFKTTGDGFLAEFGSVVNAVACAVDIQRSMAIRNVNLAESSLIAFRIGVTLGDVIIEGSDVFGDGVNLAARLEAIAPAGGIVISGSARDHLGSRLNIELEDQGEHSLKNVPNPVKVFAVKLELESKQPPRQSRGKPSIAVLPFQNLSADPEQEYFADGIVDELITILARQTWLTVISRSSVFSYKNKHPDARRAGRELGVQYILEGSVRKSASQIRITGQLTDTTSGISIWGSHFDGKMENIFELQDQVTIKVMGAIQPRLEHAELQRSLRKPTTSLDAYDHYLRGLSEVERWTRDANNEALKHFYRAIELDRSFAAAYGMAARCLSQRKTSSWVEDEERERAEAEGLATLAVTFGRDDPVALAAAGIALAFVVGKVREGGELINQSLAINPGHAAAWMYSSWVNAWSGNADEATRCVERAMELSPQDPYVWSMRRAMAFAHFIGKRYEESIASASSVTTSPQNAAIGAAAVAASAALLGRDEEARWALQQLRSVEPHLRLSTLRSRFPIVKDDDYRRFVDALRLAGMPE